MADPNTEQPSRLKRAAELYGQVSDVLTPGRLGLLLGAALLVVIGAFGGWNAVTDSADETSEVGASEAFSADPFELTVRRAVVFDELEGVFPAEEGMRYISVSADVENTTDLPVSSFVLAGDVVLEVDGVETIEFDDGSSHPRDPGVVRTADSLSARSFQPGLPVNVVLVWKQDAAEPVPAEISVLFPAHSWRRSVMDDSFGWRDPVPTARVSLPLAALGEAS